MLKVEYSSSGFENKIACVKALRDIRPGLSLKEAKDMFEGNILFITGAEWDVIGDIFHSAALSPAKSEDERVYLTRLIDQAYLDKDDLLTRIRNLEARIQELRSLLEETYHRSP